MPDFKPEVQLSGDILDGDLAMSSGVAAPPAGVRDGPAYGDNAFAPKHPWRRVAFSAPPGSQRAQAQAIARPAISIVTLPSSVMERFERLGVSAVQTLRDVDALRRRPETEDAIRFAAAYVRETYVDDDDGEPLCLGLSAYPSGMETVSYDHQRRIRVGLHVDDWDDLPLSQRGAGRQILNLNLGRSTRHFLFMDTPIDEMSGADDPTAKTSIVVKRFLQNNPDAPVWRLAVRPGCAYVAPTNRIIHDGSNALCTSLDVHLAMLGQFKRCFSR